MAPLNTKIAGQVWYIKDKEAIYLIRDQARHVYKKTESGSVINIDTIKQEINQDVDEIDDTNGEINPYHEIVVNKAERDNTIIWQMEQWLILSNVVNYVQYNRHPKNFYNLDIKAVDQKRHKKTYNKEKERQILELDFGDTPEKLKGEYLDMYKGIQKEVISTTRFDENSDLITTYLGRIDMIRASKIKAEERFPISGQGYMIGKLLDWTECPTLLDTGARKSFMSTSHYLCCKSLHSSPKFASKTQRIQVENGKFINISLIIPIIIDIHDHRFEINTLVSEIHENIDLVIGIKIYLN